MERNLKFIETMTVDQFKEMYDVDELEIKKNESTGNRCKAAKSDTDSSIQFNRC